MRKDKVRDIARGVLPSTARKSARDNKRNFHAKHRHAQRQVNHAIERTLATVSEHGTVVHDPNLYDDFEDREVFDGYHASTKDDGLGWDDLSPNGEIIYSRRGADKLGPLIRWAEAVEKRLMDGWDTADRYAYFKAILPDTLQGRHALSHVQSALRLYPDEFERRYFGGTLNYTTFVDFRNALDRCLATQTGRRSLRDFIIKTVPVAAHHTQANNKIKRSERAVDENGLLRYTTLANGTSLPVYVDVLIPQIVSVTCDDCTFLRNDPLATPEAIKRFVEFVWDRPRNGTHPWYVRHRYAPRDDHGFRNEVIGHVLSF